MHKGLRWYPGEETIAVIIGKLKAVRGPMVKKPADFILTQCSPNLFEYWVVFLFWWRKAPRAHAIIQNISFVLGTGDSPVLSLIRLDAWSTGIFKHRASTEILHWKRTIQVAIRVGTNVFPSCLLLDLNSINLVTSSKANEKQKTQKVPKLNPQAQEGRHLGRGVLARSVWAPVEEKIWKKRH